MSLAVLKLEDWQKHIRDTHVERKGRSVCGVVLLPFDWTFTDTDHAFNSILAPTFVQPCPACARVVAEAFGKMTQ